MHALRAFKVKDDVIAKSMANEVGESVSDEMNFYWLNAVAREIGWMPILTAMSEDARKDFTIDALSLTPSENKAFLAAVCGDESFRRDIFATLLETTLSSRADDTTAEDALVNFLRRVGDIDANWINRQAVAVRSFLLKISESPSFEAQMNRLTRILPWISPSDMSGGEHTGWFVNDLVRETIKGIENRRQPLDGSRIALLAACFSRRNDVEEPSVVVSLEDAVCAPLMEVYRAISKREAAEAAASAAAARFGSNEEPIKKSEEADAGIAVLIAAIVRRTAASLESRDWGAIFGRLDAWTIVRATSAEACAECEGVDGDDGSTSACAAASIVCLIDALPMELLEPTKSSAGDAMPYSAGDVVPYSSHGAAAMSVAKALAHAGWPRDRLNIVERLYRCAILAGAELRDIEDDDSDDRRTAFWRRCREETRLWTLVAALACGDAPTSESALQAGLYVDAWESAPCETIAALYQLLGANGVLGDDDEASEALRRAAYGLLASKTLIQPAVVGLDASIADVDKVEKALDAALAAADENDDASVENFGTPAESAGLRENLAELLSGKTDLPANVSLLGWALLLRYTLTLPIDSSCRERLVNYTRETKAVPTLMREISRTMPLPESPDIEQEVDAPSAWQGIDWNDPTSPSQIFNPRFSIQVLIYGAALYALPASIRTFVSDMKPQRDAKRLEAATAVTVSPTLITAEFRAVSGMTFTSDGSGSLTVKPSVNTREVLTTYEIDESSLQLTVKLPMAYPLAPAELVCAERVGVSEARLRKWMLGITAILKHQNGAVAQGLLQWQRNIDAEFAGVEPCPICYAVLHPVDHQKPRLQCRQCSNKFHATCLYTWFRSSSKSSCPLCVTPWGSSYR